MRNKQIRAAVAEIKTGYQNNFFRRFICHTGDPPSPIFFVVSDFGVIDVSENSITASHLSRFLRPFGVFPLEYFL